jgi:thiosulfate reductase cytochrome b subunit
MSAIVAFLVVHVALVILVPRTFIAMVTGRAAESVPHARMETMP